MFSAKMNSYAAESVLRMYMHDVASVHMYDDASVHIYIYI